MKAWLSRTPGGPETLVCEDISRPSPGPGQVVVQVAAVAVNYPDVLMLEDLYQVKPPRPFVPGGDVSGVIVEVGEGVTGFSIGDRVCAIAGLGGLAEYVAMDTWKVTVIPDELSLDVASTLKTAYGTGIHGLLDRGQLKAGDSVLVVGASGGVGLAAVELAKALGAGRVVGAVSTPAKTDAVRAAGADEVILYPPSPLDRPASKALAESFKAACPGGYDVIYDVIGGDYADPAIRSIAWEGRYLVIGFTAGIPKLATNLPLLKACSVVGVFWGMWAKRNPDRWGEEVDMLLRFCVEGKIRPLISKRYAFEEAPDALADMRNRKVVGKLVIAVAEDVV